MNIVLPASRRLVSELRRDIFDNLDQNRFGRIAAGVADAFGQEKAGREAGAAPGAEVLSGEIGSADLTQVLVDVAGVDALRLAFLVEIFEQGAAGDIFAALQNAREPSVLHGDLMMLAALAAEAELQRVA